MIKLLSTFSILLLSLCNLNAEAWYSAPLSAQELMFGNALKWSTVWEINVERFIIEKSIDGVSFDEIGTLQASGFSNVDKSYHFLDVNPIGDVAFYRLRELAPNGKFSFSQVIVVERSITNDLHMLSMSSVLVSKNFTVRFDAMKDVKTTCILRNFKGEVLDQYQKELKSGLNEMIVDLQQRSPGYYFFSVVNGDERENFTLQRVQTEDAIIPPVASSRKEGSKN